ncbi:hypothetical protein ABER02_21220 [Rossellomorea marisflavi]|nr:hypothetical protein [Rossellomorea marisflavi]
MHQPPQLTQAPQLTHEHDPQHDVLPDELDPLVAPVSDNIIDSDTSITSMDSISSNKDSILRVVVIISPRFFRIRYPQLVQPPQLTQEHDPQHDVLPDELDPLVAPVSDSIMDSDTSMTSMDSIS